MHNIDVKLNKEGENMIYLLNAPFILDFIATACLFVLCYLVVVGFKVALSSLKEFFPKRENVIPKDTQTKTVKLTTKKSKRRAVSKPVRSIEINPDEIDRIYVKKIS